MPKAPSIHTAGKGHTPRRFHVLDPRQNAHRSRDAEREVALPDFDVFLSYHWRDHAAVEGLARRLQEAGLQVFLDRWYLTPGTNWLHSLEATLSRCSAVAVCTGSDMGPWQQREAYAALERQVEVERQGRVFPVIPVLLPGAEAPLGFLKQNTWVDLRERADDPTRLAILVKAIRGEPPGPALQATIDQTLAQVCPYRGLLYFREEDAPFFYGREAATTQLIEAVGQQRLVAVVGASGSGKSSLVRAGLVPALRRQRDRAWEIVTVVPGDRPLYNLAAVLQTRLDPELGEVARLEAIQTLAEALATGRLQLRDVIERVLERQPGTDRLLLVIDQWEELFTLTEDAQHRQRLIDGVLEATLRSPLHVVLTVRGDFFGRAVTGQRALSDRLQNAQINLGPMNADELRSAIVEPARKVGLAFEPNLVELILEHAEGEPGHLPLLEFVLRELWEQRRGGLMHREAYDAMGQLEGAIAARADRLLADLVRADPAATRQAESIFLRLVRPGEGEQDTRRRAAEADFDATTLGIIRRLSDERLLVTSRAAGAATSPTVELAHEALIRHWATLQGWIKDNRAFMVWRQRLNEAAHEWQAQKRGRDLLLRGLPLAQATTWRKQRGRDLSALEHEYIQSSAQRRWWTRTGATVVASVALGTIVFFAITANQERRGADAARERAEAARERADAARARAEALLDYMQFDLRDQLAPVGRLDLMTGIDERVAVYYKQLGDEMTDDIQRGRAVSFLQRGNTFIAQGRLGAARAAYEEAREIADRLVQVDPYNPQWQRDLSVSFERLGNVEVGAGRLDAARAAYEQSREIRERLVKADATNTQWQRDFSVSYDKLGDVEVASGRLDAARAAYEQSREICERLVKADATNTEWQRGLSVSYDKLGNVEVASGRLDEARAAYEQSLEIAERLAKTDAANAEWQRDLSVSYEKLGDVEVASGRLDAARKAYKQSLEIAERLAKTDAANTEWQRDLSASYDKLGDVEVASGRLDEARAAYEQSRKTAERLAKTDAANTKWQRDLSVSYDKLGDVEVGAGRLDAARAAYEQSREIRERLVKADATNTQWKRGLSVSYDKLGDVEVGAGRLDAARAAYEQSREIRERLVKADATNTQWQRDLSVSYEKLGNVEVASGRLDVARAAYEQSREIRERLVKVDATNIQWQRDLSVSHYRLGDVLARANQRAEALMAVRRGLVISERLVALDSANAAWRGDLAWARAKLAELEQPATR